ncbi:hypothetical protein [Streptomyces antibioticus]|uniref:Uncharacterized protein n=1 Tax=Streptomyces antibioticus TaxID=1890 RepID=A0AAE6YDX3_STRAT|nr:hypothetical protein [Streptomyces antibioticus]OOQ47331.1 hypothetical protein AFM16_31825 [Streptomyces antibioticus]QIT47652.1 hypothetical protein HCX60_32375 [Streptomyces antibioticus]
MNGPDHYREGERLLAGQPIHADDLARGVEPGTWPPTQMELLTAQNHFLAALVAVLAADRFPDSVTWNEVLGP